MPTAAASTTEAAASSTAGHSRSPAAPSAATWPTARAASSTPGHSRSPTSTISGNGAAFGGGIWNYPSGTLTVTDSTISDNTVGNDGGGIYNTATATLTVTNSTISGNTAGSGPGGGIENAGTLTVTNSTISGNTTTNNGGGISNTGTLTVTDSTLSGNTAGLNGDGISGAVMLTGSILDNAAANVAGPLTSGGHNLFSDDPSETDNAVLISTDLVDTDPLLGPLADNGGPTQTMALLPGSPAINTGVAIAGVTTDQRGVAQAPGERPDIGAFELDQADQPFVQLIRASGPMLVGTDQTVTATVFGTDLQPLSGVPVTFQVTAGPNAGAKGSTDPSDGLTDSGGHVSFTYTGTGGVGQDIVVATAMLPGGATADSPPASVNWGSLTVTTLDDAGFGSLRMAIGLANEPGGPQTITFDPSVTGTITLTTALPDLSSGIDIEGPERRR